MSLPAALKPLMQRDRWLIWRYVDGKKVPFDPKRPGRHASVKDPKTWSTYQQARRAAPEDGGVGFVIGDDIAAFDLDDCRDPDTGKLTPWAEELIEEANSYCEVTPSGVGLRIIGVAKGERVHKHVAMRTGKVEVYRGECGRYIAITGDNLNGASLRNIDPAIDATVATPNDTTASNTAKDKSRSAQFYKQCCMLFERGRSVEQVEQEIVAHPNKYKHGSAQRYDSEGRLREQIEECHRKWSDSGGKVKARAAAHSTGATSNDALPYRWIGASAPAPTEWLVKGLILRKGVGLLVGKWGSGKTYVAIDLSLAVSTGESFAGRKTRHCGVLYISAERSAQMHRRARFMAHRRLLLSPPVIQCETCPPLTGDDSLAVLVATVKAADAEVFARRGIHIGLVIIDTLVVAAGWTDESSSAEVQKVMRAMRALSEAAGTFVLAVDHTGKDASRGARGSSDKESSSDVVLTVSDCNSLGVTKITDGHQGLNIPFELVEHQDGHDEDGDPVTECTVKWDGVVAPAKRSDEDEGHVLKVLFKHKSISITAIASKLDWHQGNGKLARSRVQKAQDRLVEKGLAQKGALSRLVLTEKGLHEAKKSVLEHG